MKNIDKYKIDLNNLIAEGNQLLISMYLDTSPDNAKKALKSKYGDDYESSLKDLPEFRSKYQEWYSESKILIKQLLPDRYDDFVKAYEKPKMRKVVEFGNYVIEDYLIGLRVTRGLDTKVNTSAAFPVFQQQLKILESVRKRFKSSLFDIEQLVQADVFDSELESAKQLIRCKFYRAAGAIAGVVLEKHLKQICRNHSIRVTKTKPNISDLNDLLKKESIIDVAQWRFIQHLGDLRNLCDHAGDKEPGLAESQDLADGVDKIIKTIY